MGTDVDVDGRLDAVTTDWLFGFIAGMVSAVPVYLVVDRAIVVVVSRVVGHDRATE